MAIIAYPLNNIEYSAEDAMLLNLPVSSGIYAEGDNFPITITASLSATIGAGLGFMRYDKAKGFTFYQKEAEQVSFDPADTVLPRIDRVVLRWDEAKNGVFVAVKKGVPSSTPKATERSTSPALYELVLYDIEIRANTTSLSLSNIVDQRLNPDLCGIMANNITKIDFASIFGKVLMYSEQTLTSSEKEQARTNIGAASTEDIPQKTSQLKNDSGFLTSQDIKGKLDKSGGTMTGVLTAQNNTSYATKQVRNVFLIPDGAGLPSGENGDVCFVYIP